MKDTNHYHRIHQTIDHSLHYPPEFKDADIGGTVRASLVFSKEGVFLRKQSKVKSASRYLRVFILRLLRKSFSKPYHKEGKPIRVDCMFDFVVTRREDPFNASPDNLLSNPARNGFIGNRLFFYRSAKVIGMWKIGPLAGYGIGGVSLDLFWFVNKAVEGVDHLRGKMKIDPLAKYRRDPEW